MEATKTMRLPVVGSSFERLLSEEEAIEVLGMAQRTKPKNSLRWLMRTRRLPYFRLAKGVYGFKREDLATFIDSCRVPAAGE